MKILLGNDDGHNAIGIQTLKSSLEKEGHEVYVAAPTEERSGQSHAMTFFKPLVANLVSDRFLTVNGTPADCIAIALLDIWKELEFDLVLSGINKGLNVGTDVNYSGTVGAATEGALMGKKAIAVSVDLDRLHVDGITPEEAYLNTAKMAIGIINQLQNSQFNWPKNVVLNFNHPGFHPKGLKLAKCMSQNMYIPHFEKFSPSSSHLSSQKIYVLGGSKRRAGADTSQDVGLIMEGYATLSLLDSRQSSASSQESLGFAIKGLLD